MLEPDYDLGILTTASGRRVDVVHPETSMFFIEDIARSLSRQCRYLGHFSSPDFYYSVAQHSFLMSLHVGDDPIIQLAALLHDAAEAYLGDMPAPIKGLPELTSYRLLERRVAAAIFSRFGLPLEIPRIVKEVDLRIRVNERQVLQGYKPVKSDRPLPLLLCGWTPGVAEKNFLARFHELSDQLFEQFQSSQKKEEAHV